MGRKYGGGGASKCGKVKHGGGGASKCGKVKLGRGAAFPTALNSTTLLAPPHLEQP